MVTELFIGGFLVVMLGAGWLVHRFSEDEKIKRLLRSASRWPIAELPESTLGRVVGRARLVGAPLTAPISGRECAYYIVEVILNYNDSKATLFGEVKMVPFVVEDDTGRAFVDPEGARITLNFDLRGSSSEHDAPTDHERALLKRHGFGDEDTVKKSLTYREAVISPGELVAVLGSGIREPDPDAMPTASYRGDMATRLRFTSSPRYPLVISDEHVTTMD